MINPLALWNQQGTNNSNIVYEYQRSPISIDWGSGWFSYCSADNSLILFSSLIYSVEFLLQMHYYQTQGLYHKRTDLQYWVEYSLDYYLYQLLFESSKVIIISQLSLQILSTFRCSNETDIFAFSYILYSIQLTKWIVIVHKQPAVKAGFFWFLLDILHDWTWGGIFGVFTNTIYGFDLTWYRSVTCLISSCSDSCV